MPELCPFDYAVIRVVPRVERGEFVNAGVIVSCPSKGYLKAGVELDAERLAALDPAFDREAVERHLAAIQRVCEDGDEMLEHHYRTMVARPETTRKED